MIIMKCAECGKVIDTTKTHKENGTIVIDNAYVVIINGKKIMCKDCYNKYKNERNR